MECTYECRSAGITEIFSIRPVLRYASRKVVDPRVKNVHCKSTDVWVLHVPSEIEVRRLFSPIEHYQIWRLLPRNAWTTPEKVPRKPWSFWPVQELASAAAQSQCECRLVLLWVRLLMSLLWLVALSSHPGRLSQPQNGLEIITFNIDLGSCGVDCTYNSQTNHHQISRAHLNPNSYWRSWKIASSLRWTNLAICEYILEPFLAHQSTLFGRSAVN